MNVADGARHEGGSSFPLIAGGDGKGSCGASRCDPNHPGVDGAQGKATADIA
jgi:hypothetical protein